MCNSINGSFLVKTIINVLKFPILSNDPRHDIRMWKRGIGRNFRGSISDLLYIIQRARMFTKENASETLCRPQDGLKQRRGPFRD
jgi:hypothetical protein